MARKQQFPFPQAAKSESYPLFNHGKDEEKGVWGKSTTDLASICQDSEGESDCCCCTQDHLSDLTIASSLFFEGEETALVEGEPKREGQFPKETSIKKSKRTLEGS